MARRYRSRKRGKRGGRRGRRLRGMATAMLMSRGGTRL